MDGWRVKSLQSHYVAFVYKITRRTTQSEPQPASPRDLTSRGVENLLSFTPWKHNKAFVSLAGGAQQLKEGAATRLPLIIPLCTGDQYEKDDVTMRMSGLGLLQQILNYAFPAI